MKKQTTLKKFKEIINKCDSCMTYDDILFRIMSHYDQRTKECIEKGYTYSAESYNEKSDIIFHYLLEQDYFE